VIAKKLLQVLKPATGGGGGGPSVPTPTVYWEADYGIVTTTNGTTADASPVSGNKVLSWTSKDASASVASYSVNSQRPTYFAPSGSKPYVRFLASGSETLETTAFVSTFNNASQYSMGVLFRKMPAYTGYHNQVFLALNTGNAGSLFAQGGLNIGQIASGGVTYLGGTRVILNGISLPTGVGTLFGSFSTTSTSATVAASSNTRLYYNGILVASDTASSATLNYSDKIILNNFVDPPNSVNTEVFGFYLYSTQLSDTQITSVHNDCFSRFNVGDLDFSSVSLLLHMDGTNGSTTFVDSGPNAVTITAAGDAQISTTQSKFGGASAYFDGVGDSLFASSSTLFSFSGDFTVEGWFYFSQVNQYNGATILISMNVLNAFQLGTEGNNIRLRFNGTLLIDYANTASNLLNKWTHIAVTRKDSTVTLRVNGTSVSSATSTASTSVSSISIGQQVNNAAFFHYFNGYIDDLRITKGIARYLANFTPPTAAYPDLYNPYTTLPVSGAALWLSAPQTSSLYTDAGATNVIKANDAVYQWNDLSGNNRHATQTTSANRPTWVAPASGRNGLGAVAFNGSQFIGSSNTGSVSFGTGDFTVEGWIKPSSFSGNNILLYSGNGGFLLYFNSSGLFKVSNWGVADYITTSTAISTTNWTHFAVTRASGTLRLFLNGSQTNSVSNSVNFSPSTFLLGWDNNASNPKYVGQIQNLLIYNGQALYTSNFTPWMS
jgi:hypothetical protein